MIIEQHRLARVFTLFVIIGLLPADGFAGKPDRCTPWPECRDVGDPPEPTPGNSVILAGDSSGNSRIVAMDAEGGNIVTVSKHSVNWETLHWSPGGTYAAAYHRGQAVLCPRTALEAHFYDEASNTWADETTFVCLPTDHLAGNYFEIIPNLHSDDSTAQILLRADEVTNLTHGDVNSLDSGGIHLTAAFKPGDTSGTEVQTVQILDHVGHELNLDRNIGLHQPALSRFATWLVYHQGDNEDTYDAFVVRPFNKDIITPDLANMEAADVVGNIAVQVFSTDIGITIPRYFDFAEHVETSFVFSADGDIFCVDFSAVTDPDTILPLTPAVINLTAGAAAVVPSGSTSSHPTWRPDGGAVLFGTVLNAGSSNAEKVIAEIVFPTPIASGCPDTDTLGNSVFNIFAGGGTKRRDPHLVAPIYWRNAPPR
jgi:hypothetical protein